MTPAEPWRTRAYDRVTSRADHRLPGAASNRPAAIAHRISAVHGDRSAGGGFDSPDAGTAAAIGAPSEGTVDGFAPAAPVAGQCLRALASDGGRGMGDRGVSADA